ESRIGELGFNGDLAQQQFCEAHVRFGSKADISECPSDVCFTPNSGHWLSGSRCPLCAKSRHQPTHSMTSSARTSNEGGMLSPRAFAVVRFISNSNFDAK